jgi:hypothetical protein
MELMSQFGLLALVGWVLYQAFGKGTKKTASACELKRKLAPGNPDVLIGYPVYQPSTAPARL